jgi:predicted AAA+ superfamily ATPase
MQTQQAINWETTLAAVWRNNRQYLKPINEVDLINIDDLLGIQRQKDELCQNTEKLLQDKAANHALLWGSRGTGKSSLIKAVLNKYQDKGLRIIEIPKNDLSQLLDITDDIRMLKQKFIVFCDDISFDEGDNGYRALKSVLEGSIEKPPANVLVYATSNHRHMVTEKMKDNLDAKMVDGTIHPGETIEEKMSLADRFGLSLSFYPINQDTYLNIIDHYFADYAGERAELHIAANRFAIQRGIRSGRVAKQFHTYFDKS